MTEDEELQYFGDLAEMQRLTPEQEARFHELCGPLGPNEGVAAWESFRIQRTSRNYQRGRSRA